MLSQVSPKAKVVSRIVKNLNIYNMRKHHYEFFYSFEKSTRHSSLTILYPLCKSHINCVNQDLHFAICLCTLQPSSEAIFLFLSIPQMSFRNLSSNTLAGNYLTSALCHSLLHSCHRYALLERISLHPSVPSENFSCTLKIFSVCLLLLSLTAFL